MIREKKTTVLPAETGPRNAPISTFAERLVYFFPLSYSSMRFLFIFTFYLCTRFTTSLSIRPCGMFFFFFFNFSKSSNYLFRTSTRDRWYCRFLPRRIKKLGEFFQKCTHRNQCSEQKYKFLS